jgi:hypothetical protein
VKGKYVREITTKRSFVPMLVMLSSLSLLIGGTSFVQRAAGITPAKVSVSEPVLQELHQTVQLLEQGREAEAKVRLDALNAMPITIDAGSHGDGPLKEFAPTTLLMQTGRAILRRAELAATRGDRNAAFGWIERCRELSEQTLASPTPNMDALNVARYLDKHSATTEVSVLETLHEHDRAQLAEARGNTLQKVWRKTIMTRVNDFLDRWSQEDSLRFLNAAGVVPEMSEPRKQEEKNLAADLIRLYKAERKGVRVAQYPHENA